jgi:hypothetical protein
MFEYYDDRPSVIVGQWFAPQTYTAVDFDPCEVVREVKVLSRTGEMPGPPGGYFSRPTVTVTGIQIEIQTAAGDPRTVSFVAPETNLDSLEEGRWLSVHWQKDWRKDTAAVDHGHEVEDNVDLVRTHVFLPVIS